MDSIIFLWFVVSSMEMILLGPFISPRQEKKEVIILHDLLLNFHNCRQLITMV